jgi:uncharacterized repeat protein (TIGR02543 family)
MEELIRFFFFLSAAALLALFAQGTRILLAKGRLRFALRRLLPWLLWAAPVAVLVLVTVFIAFSDLMRTDTRAGLFTGGAEGPRVPVSTPERTPAQPRDDEAGEKDTVYPLSFETGADGAPLPAHTAEAGAEVTLPRLQDQKGRRFTGWYADRDLTEPIESVTMDAPKTVYAGWLPTLDTATHRAYMLGYPDGAFRPEAGLSRAETLVLFTRLLEEPLSSAPAESRFADVRADSRYAAVLRGMERYGIIRGYPDGSFLPDADISRAEFVSVCIRLAEKKAATGEDVFPSREASPETVRAREALLADLPASHWSRAIIADAAARGWLDACASSGPAFAPDGRVTRAEAVTIVNRMLSRRADTIYIRTHALAGFRDVPPDFWAYADIMESACEHGFAIENGEERWKPLSETRTPCRAGRRRRIVGVGLRGDRGASRPIPHRADGTKG